PTAASGYSHLDAFPTRRSSDLASGSLERARAVAAEFDVSHAFGSGEALARAPDVDLVIVSSTPDAHVRHAVAALEAGKHVLCEKDRKSTRLNSSHQIISYAVFC